MLFGEKILDYWNDIMRDLKTLVAIPSVARPQEGPHPFGDECARALDTVLGLAESYGLKTKNVGYYAGHAEYGQGEGNAVVMAHVDVVPAGEGWSADPFTMRVEGNRAFGRGVADDKGAAVIALHCLRALKDAGVVGRRKLRVIFGCGEEIGMADMGRYFQQEQRPDMGFTPDSSYGICHCEKGIFNFRAKDSSNSGVVESFAAGTVVNAVPAKAQCHVKCTEQEYRALEKAAKQSPIEIAVTRVESGASLLAKGQAAHAAWPQGGKNAALYLTEVLWEVFGERVGKLLQFVHKKIGLTSDGSLAGVAMRDEPSGDLTFNLGLLRIGEGESSLTVDIRYPATKDGIFIDRTLRAAVESCGLRYTLISDAKPLYLPKESPLIELLSGAYKDVTGEECGVYSMGGGTYARQMFGKGVAFGPGFPDQEDSHEHDVDERIDLRRMRLHAQICLEAMYRMLTAEL